MKMKNVLIVGNGGREHALAWKAAQSAQVAKVFVAPGNPGTATEAKTTNVAIEATNITELVSFAQQQSIDITIVGPELALAAGIVDAFEHANLNCLGPRKNASFLETSKGAAKAFMLRHNIPTAHFGYFYEANLAKDYVKQCKLPIVIKADGLAAGKGVIIAYTAEQAFDAIDAMLQSKKFGEAGEQIIIEDFLVGEEVSFIILTDGKHIIPLAHSQDHKARDDHNQGPNTGGMGAYSPTPFISETLSEKIVRTVFEPALQGMIAEGVPYQGFLYAGLMMDKQGNFNVLEFNCRLGDPETQVIMMRLNSDLIELCSAVHEHKLANLQVAWDPRAAVGVVLTAKGYPDQYQKGQIIYGLENTVHDYEKIFHAGTNRVKQHIIANGGRILTACALGDDIQQAHNRAYKLLHRLNCNEFHYRHDIGQHTFPNSAAQS